MGTVGAKVALAKAAKRDCGLSGKKGGCEWRRTRALGKGVEKTVGNNCEVLNYNYYMIYIFKYTLLYLV